MLRTTRTVNKSVFTKLRREYVWSQSSLVYRKRNTGRVSINNFTKLNCNLSVYLFAWNLRCIRSYLHDKIRLWAKIGGIKTGSRRNVHKFTYVSTLFEEYTYKCNRFITITNGKLLYVFTLSTYLSSGSEWRMRIFL